MTISRVAIDFSKNKFSDLELSSKCAHVLLKMTDNPHFIDPEPSLLLISQSKDRYDKALEEQLNQTKISTSIKKACRRELEQLMKQLAIYVDQKGYNHAEILLSSGFDLHKSKPRIRELEKPVNPAVTFGCNHGCLILSCNTIEKARWYEFEYTPFPATDESIWIRRSTSRRKIEINGLTSGCQYVFRVAGATSSNHRSWSDQVVSYVG